jgi:hypothetical protein
VRQILIVIGGAISFFLIAFGAYMVFIKLIPRELEIAVRRNDIATIQEILDYHPALTKEVINPSEGTALTMAVMNSNELTVKTLLHYPFDLNYACPSGGTPLQWACCFSRTDIVQVLIEAGADVNFAAASDNSHGTPLQNAAQSGNYEIVVLLVKHGADVNGLDPTGHTGPPLFEAIWDSNDHWSDRKKILQFLFDRGATIPQPKAPGTGGMSIIEGAKFYKAPEDVIELLKQHGAKE